MDTEIDVHGLTCNEGRTCVYLKKGGEKNAKTKWCIN